MLLSQEFVVQHPIFGVLRENHFEIAKQTYTVVNNKRETRIPGYIGCLATHVTKLDGSAVGVKDKTRGGDLSCGNNVAF